MLLQAGAQGAVLCRQFLLNLQIGDGLDRGSELESNSFLYAMLIRYVVVLKELSLLGFQVFYSQGLLLISGFDKLRRLGLSLMANFHLVG